MIFFWTGFCTALSSTISHDTATPSTKTKSGKPFKTRVQPPLSSLSAPCSLAAGDQLGYCFHPHFCFDQFASDNALWTPSCANGIGFWSPLTSSSGDSAKRSWKSSWLGRWSTVDRFWWWVDVRGGMKLQLFFFN